VACDGNKSGYLAVADLPVPNLQPLDAIFRLPIKDGTQLLTQVLASGGTGIQVVKNAPTTASLTRDAAHLKFVVGRGELNADSSAPADGHVGIGVLNSALVVDRVKITGEIEQTWFDSAK
jgi:hypothetical protein